MSSAAAGASFPECGDGLVDVAGEHCDGTDLGGATCASLGFGSGALACTVGCKFDTSACVSGGSGTGQAFPATGQTTCWDPADTTNPIDTIPCAGTGQDGEIQAGATLSYTDNGDGTITDANTQLIWEQLADDGSIHDKDDTYTWANAFAVKIAVLNTPPCFAGHCDWRLPNIKELQSIVNAGSIPVVSPGFNTACTSTCTVLTCSCTGGDFYWSATTNAANPIVAFNLGFDVGWINGDAKGAGSHVRAVRAGL